MRIRMIAATLLLFFSLQTSANAASFPIVVQLTSPANLSLVTRLLGGTVLDSIPEANIYLLRVPSIPLLQPNALLGIKFIELDKVVSLPSYAQSALLTTTKSGDWYKNQPKLLALRLPQAQTYSTGRGVVVADLNSEIDYSHPALRGHLTGGYDFVTGRATSTGTLDQSEAAFLDQSEAAFLDQSEAAFLDQSSAAFLDQSEAAFLDQSEAAFLDQSMSAFLNQSEAAFIDQSAAAFLDQTLFGLLRRDNAAFGHGTMCAGLIAAVAPDAMIMPLRVFNNDGGANVFSIAKAIYYASRNGAHVINMSFGMDASYKSVQTAIDFASNRGVVVVASAGNADVSKPQYPAAYSSVISVAATTVLDKKASFSNYGSWIFVSAPGVNLISAYPNGKYGMASGTSFAAPLVAGEAALIRALWTRNVKDSIGRGTAPIDAKNPAYAGKLGSGRIDILSGVSQ